MSDNRIPLAGVIGAPVAHSRSPRLFAHWLRSLGLRGHYIPMEVAQSDLPEVLRTLPKVGFVGLNVTIPHKETVLLVLVLANFFSDNKADPDSFRSFIIPVAWAVPYMLL
ncbi:MAG: hypothetical protein H5U18_02375, partial [Rhodobacteraceae bacterium]|nr:hypothetical protein [Paracoccaceae bacterium]